jgi:(p)ppGpp synthase/HD superfamily hydrolase
MDKVTQAITMAAMAHDGQKDKAGLPYILHPLRVGSMGKTEDEMIVGFLHDTLEDTKLDHELILEVFGERICESVWVLTHLKDESYTEYIHQIGSVPLCRTVKINDIYDNTRADRMNVLPEADRVRLTAKYDKALRYLQGLQ